MLTHFKTDGKTSMVDVSDKQISHRTASAYCKIILGKAVIHAIQNNALIKGDAFNVAKIAGIMAAKKTAELIPMCHSLTLDMVDIEFTILDYDCVEVRSQVICHAKTGVEMEAIVAVSHAAITLYDMCKSLNKKIVIQDIHLESKTGGKSGDFLFKNE